MVGKESGVLDVLENELGLDIPVAGLRKNDKHQTSELLYGPNADVVPLKNSQAFYLLHRIQDEVHRFAITFHRQTRQKQVYNLYWTLLTALEVNVRRVY